MYSRSRHTFLVRYVGECVMLGSALLCWGASHAGVGVPGRASITKQRYDFASSNSRQQNMAGCKVQHEQEGASKQGADGFTMSMLSVCRHGQVLSSAVQSACACR